LLKIRSDAQKKSQPEQSHGCVRIEIFFATSQPGKFFAKLFVFGYYPDGMNNI